MTVTFSSNPRLAASNSCYDVVLHELRCDDRVLVEDYLVVEPKRRNAEGFTGVAILPILNKKLGLIQIYRPAIQALAWEVPRGFVEDSESCEQAAIRELQEETGLKPVDSIVSLHSLGAVYPDSGVLRAKVALYCAEILSDVDELPLKAADEGIRALRWFDKQEMIECLGEGRILDAAVIVACIRALEKIG